MTMYNIGVKINKFLIGLNKRPAWTRWAYTGQETTKSVISEEKGMYPKNQ